MCWEVAGAEAGEGDHGGEAEAGWTHHRDETREPLKGLEQRRDSADGQCGGWPGEALGSPLRQRDVLTQFPPLPSDLCSPASCWPGSTEPQPGRGRQGEAGHVGSGWGRMTDFPWVVPVGATTTEESL